MIEILGVLAIVAVLSIGSLFGYNFAMRKYRYNTFTEQFSLLAINLASVLQPYDFPPKGEDRDITEWMTKMDLLPVTAFRGNVRVVLSGIGENGQRKRLWVYYDNPDAYTCRQLMFDRPDYMDVIGIVSDGELVATTEISTRDEWLSMCRVFESSGLQAAELSGNWLKLGIDLELVVATTGAPSSCESGKRRCGGACLPEVDGDRTLQPNCQYLCTNASFVWDGEACVPPASCPSGTTACSGHCLPNDDPDATGRILNAETCHYQCPPNKPFFSAPLTAGWATDGSGQKTCMACPTAPDYAFFDESSGTCACVEGRVPKVWSPGCKCPENSILSGGKCVTAYNVHNHEQIPEEYLCAQLASALQEISNFWNVTVPNNVEYCHRSPITGISVCTHATSSTRYVKVRAYSTTGKMLQIGLTHVFSRGSVLDIQIYSSGNLCNVPDGSPIYVYPVAPDVSPHEFLFRSTAWYATTATTLSVLQRVRQFLEDQ